MLELAAFPEKHHTDLIADGMCAPGHGTQRLAATPQLQAATQVSRHVYAFGRFCAGDSRVLPGAHAPLCLQDGWPRSCAS